MGRRTYLTSVRLSVTQKLSIALHRIKRQTKSNCWLTGNYIQCRGTEKRPDEILMQKLINRSLCGVSHSNLVSKVIQSQILKSGLLTNITIRCSATTVIFSALHLLDGNLFQKIKILMFSVANFTPPPELWIVHLFSKKTQIFHKKEVQESVTVLFDSYSKFVISSILKKWVFFEKKTQFFSKRLFFVFVLEILLFHSLCTVDLTESAQLSIFVQLASKQVNVKKRTRWLPDFPPILKYGGKISVMSSNCEFNIFNRCHVFSALLFSEYWVHHTPTVSESRTVWSKIIEIVWIIILWYHDRNSKKKVLLQRQFILFKFIVYFSSPFESPSLNIWISGSCCSATAEDGGSAAQLVCRDNTWQR